LLRQRFNSTLPTGRVNKMKPFTKMLAISSLLAMIAGIPAAAQMSSSVTFDASFPFYAGNAKMPAGTYTVSQNGPVNGVLLLENTSGSHSVFLEYSLTSSDAPHPQTDVTFNRYGDREFLNMVWIRGQNSGFQINESKYEEATAKNGAAVKHSVAAKNGE
jgi:hypothetical protein